MEQVTRYNHMGRPYPSEDKAMEVVKLIKPQKDTYHNVEVVKHEKGGFVVQYDLDTDRYMLMGDCQ